MKSLAAALILAALGAAPSTEPPRGGDPREWTAYNAARARAGLLPRKTPPRRPVAPLALVIRPAPRPAPAIAAGAGAPTSTPAAAEAAPAGGERRRSRGAVVVVGERVATGAATGTGAAGEISTAAATAGPPHPDPLPPLRGGRGSEAGPDGRLARGAFAVVTHEPARRVAARVVPAAFRVREARPAPGAGGPVSALLASLAGGSTAPGEPAAAVASERLAAVLRGARVAFTITVRGGGAPPPTRPARGGVLRRGVGPPEAARAWVAVALRPARG